jgi:hypothetical protein
MKRQAKQLVVDFHRRMVVGIAFALVVLAAGCGGNDNLAPVSGIVRLDGQPLTRGIVTFIPQAGRRASGEIGSDGTFHNKADGALVGQHLVTITATQAPTGPPNFDADQPNMRASNALIHARYAVPGNGLAFEVKPGETNRAEFDLATD